MNCRLWIATCFVIINPLVETEPRIAQFVDLVCILDIKTNLVVDDTCRMD